MDSKIKVLPLIAMKEIKEVSASPSDKDWRRHMHIVDILQEVACKGQSCGIIWSKDGWLPVALYQASEAE